jgi:hypothetical protein
MKNNNREKQYVYSAKTTFYSLVAIIVITLMLMLTSCSATKATQETKFVFPTYKQWLDLRPYEMKIVNDYTFKNGFIEEKYRVLKKIKFNKDGRKQIAKIHFNR